MTRETVSVNVKHNPRTSTLNLNELFMVDQSGVDHGTGPGMLIICTNFGEKIGWKEGYPRRFVVCRNNKVPLVPDRSIEDNAHITMHFEVPYCLHALGRVKKLMKDQGRKYRDLFPDSSGKGLVQRLSDMYFEDLTNDGANEQPCAWINENLKKMTGRYGNPGEIYVRYRDQSNQSMIAPVSREKFQVLCATLGYEYLTSKHQNTVDVCKACYDSSSLTFKKYGGGCCLNPSRKQKANLLKHCAYTPNHN